MRVNDLAKEIGKKNNELTAYLKEKGISKVAMSNITADEEKMLREKFNKFWLVDFLKKRIVSFFKSCNFDVFPLFKK